MKSSLFALRRSKKKKEQPGLTDHRVTYPLGPIDRRAEHNARVLRIGWIFLAFVVALTVLAVILLLPKREKTAADSTDPSAPSAATVTPMEDKKPDKKPNPGDSASGGRKVRIRSLDCEYAPPAELTVSAVRSLDHTELTAIAEAAAANVAAAGWGDIGWSAGGDILMLQAENAEPLKGADFEKQEAFLASSQPENLARTFLQDSGIIGLLRSYGIVLSTDVENNKGEIVFRGGGEDSQTDCSLRFSFLFTGAFNQAVLRLSILDDLFTTDQVVPVKKAASAAVSWSSAGEEETAVTAVEIRRVRGLPFYVFTCDDGTTAYALAVKESVLEEVPEAQAVYSEIRASGIREYVEQPGAE